jgi:Na+/proline symporter
MAFACSVGRSYLVSTVSGQNPVAGHFSFAAFRPKRQTDENVYIDRGSALHARGVSGLFLSAMMAASMSALDSV